jgi:hypothetical protein
MVITIIIAYAFMHFRLTGQFDQLTLNQIINLDMRLPFAQRLLVPLLAHGFALAIHLNDSEVFLLLEIFASSLLYLMVNQLFLLHFDKVKSQVMSLVFFLLLIVIYIVNYRFIVFKSATFFYPYDTVSLLFIALGFYLILQQKWFALMACILLATFNRESSILIVLLIPTLCVNRAIKWMSPFILAMIVYIASRLFIYMILNDAKGAYIEFNYHQFSHYYANMMWLYAYNGLFFIMACFGFVPVLWFALYDYIPKRYQAIRYLALAYFLGLLFVGNFMEPRIFGEIVMMMYLPVCIALDNWLSSEAIPIWQFTWGNFCIRYSILVCLMLFLVVLPLSIGFF